MRTKKFNLICVAVAILGWFLGSTSDIMSVALAVAAVALGIIGEMFIKTKKQKENPDAVPKIGARSVFHYILTFFMLLVIFRAFSIFADTSYGYYSFGSGKYGYEISLWSVGEIIPDFANSLGFIVLPILLVIFAVCCKPVAACISGLLCWMYILIINTSKVFGSYYIVSASGNKSGREIVVYNYSETVVKAVCILVAAVFVLAALSMLLVRIKKVAVIVILIVSLLCCGVFSYFGYTSYVQGKTFDVEGLKAEIYIDTKEGSERFQAENFFNAYGDMSTKCAFPGCERLIVTSGDSNCCAAHSRRCANCNKYIDSDAIYCMECIADAIG